MSQSFSPISISLQLASSAPSALANFLAVILDCELEDSCTLTIGGTRFHFIEERDVSRNVAFAFDGFSRADIENFFQRANFYHFREGKNLFSHLTFDLPKLEDRGKTLSLIWRDWNGCHWSFHSTM